jgi:ArsR family transcriptional regulator
MEATNQLTGQGANCCQPTERPVLPDGEAIRLASMFKVLGDATRVQIVRMLADAPELCVCDISANFSLEPSTMSHHLKVLRDAGFVTSERRGTWLFYRLDRSAEAMVRKILL